MLNKNIFIIFVFIPVLVFSLIGGCGGDSDGTSDVAEPQQVTVEGTVSDMVPENPPEQASIIQRIRNMVRITLTAIAQENEVITLQAFDQDDMLVGETVVDENGNFSIEVPCDTNLTLVFTSGDSTVEIEGIIAPCPEGEDSSTLFITVSLDFEDNTAETELEMQQSVGSAMLGCTEGEEVMNLGEDDFEMDGMGGACIITAGDCAFSLTAGSVSLVNCSTCIDTRGTSSVIIHTTKFECISETDGVRSVGDSTAQVLIVEAVDLDNEMQMVALEEDDPDIGISSGNGVSAKGSSLVVLSTLKFEEQVVTPSGGSGGPPSGGEPPMEDDKPKCNNGLGNGPEGCTPGNAPPNDEGPQNRTFVPDGTINVDGVDVGVIAVGNSEVFLEGEICTLSPEPGSETKGNAVVTLDCG